MSPEEAIAALPWTKTTYIAAHEYTFGWRNPEAYKVIREVWEREGYDRPFMGRMYHYVNIGPYRYWLYDDNDTINRALN